MEGKYYKLGKRALFLFVAEKSHLVIILIFISIASLVINVLFGEELISFLNKSFSLNLEYRPIFGYLSIITFILALIIFGIIFLISWLKYINFKFFLDENSLHIIRGILNKEEISLPYQKIQNVDIDRPLLYRFLKLSKIVILTAANDSFDTTESYTEPEAYFPAIDYKLAYQLRDELLKRANIEKVIIEKSNNLKSL